jgi:quercetin dioxygenase-like cupin family protein
MTTEPGTIVTYPEDLKWEPVGSLDENGKGIFISRLYGASGEKGPTSFLVKYSAGVKAAPHIHSGDYFAVVVSGKFRHHLESEDEYRVLTAGATWLQKGNVTHQDACVGPEDCILSTFWPEGFDVEFIEDVADPTS